ncbi:hypothetical protein F4819DRAFT_490456 [Hypoxylon fuscum]|nr:hypothetical protein F4819DRAFT_490456 [Hypoxylon fuscum]
MSQQKNHSDQACQELLDEDLDLFFQEKVVVFEENVLRHGSWYTWGEIKGKDEWKEMTGVIAKLGLRELEGFEDGRAGYEAGLNKCLMDQLKRLAGTSQNLLAKATEIIKTLIE